MKRAYYDVLPSKFEAVGNGGFRYRWDIREETVTNRRLSRIEGDSIVETQYSCYEVIVWATVTRNKITETVIGKMWDVNYEQKLINEYNSAKLGMYSSEEATEKIAAYTQFLSDRAALKTQMEADFEELNIM